MKSTVERLSPTRVRINVEVPFDELKPDFDRAYRRSPSRSGIPGFRPGKAPARILEARLGRGVVLDEVVNEAIPAKYSEAVTGRRTTSNPIGRPDIEVTEIADGDHLAFTAEVDVRPEITLPDIDGIAVTVDDVGGRRRGRHGGARQPAGPLRHADRRRAPGRRRRLRAARPVGDRRRRSRSRRPPPAASPTRSARAGSSTASTRPSRGLSAGESTTFTTQLVAGEYAGQDAEITATVTAVKERELPDADDEFAQLASEFDTLDELTDDLRTRLGQVQAHGAGRARPATRCSRRSSTPPRCRCRRASSTPRSSRACTTPSTPSTTTRSASPSSSTSRARRARSSTPRSRTEAERNVKTRLVLDALAEQEQVSVNDQELTERIIYQAQQYQMPPEEFVRRIQEAGQLGAIYSDVRRSKALIAAVARGDGHRRVGRRPSTCPT